MPVAEASYLIVQALRKNGVKGIRKRTKNEAAYNRVMAIMQTHKA